MDTVNTYEEDIEDGQHTLDMLEKADGLENPNASDRPEWLPEKFNTVEDMASAYQSLDDGEDEYEEDTGELEALSDELEELGVDFDALSEEFMEYGGLTEESYSELLGAGIPRTMVDQFIDGQVAVANQLQYQAFEQVGGQEAYNDMTDWASNNLPESTIDAFNDAVNSGNSETASLAIQGLQAQYRSVYGSSTDSAYRQSVAAKLSRSNVL